MTVWVAEDYKLDFVTKNIPEQSVLTDPTNTSGINVALLVLGIASLVLSLVHWFQSIVPLYDDDNDEEEENIELQEQTEANE